MRLFGRDEHFVAILHAELRQIDRQVMSIRHLEGDAGITSIVSSTLCPSRRACAAPTGCRARRMFRAASFDRQVRGREFDVVSRYVHVVVIERGEQAVGCFRQGVNSSRGNLKRRVRRFHDHEVRDAGGDETPW